MDHYLNDPGLYKKGTNYYCHKNNKQTVFNLNIKVPPAWTNVWYASDKKSHIQVYGTDISGKKQYIFSELWNIKARSEKYNRMKKFHKDLGSFKKKIKNNNDQICLLFNLLIHTHMRVGNEIYATQNNTYGLTTLRQKHFCKKKNYFFSFVGKSNIKHNIELNNVFVPFIKKLLTGQPNEPLFNVSSDDLNQFLKIHMGADYTCKDFRTYSANVLFIKAFLSSKDTVNPKKVVLNSIDYAANYLGHSRSISRKSYISNNLLNYCLDSFVEASDSSESELLAKL